jgi:hypothetical protein
VARFLDCGGRRCKSLAPWVRRRAPQPDFPVGPATSGSKDGYSGRDRIRRYSGTHQQSRLAPTIAQPRLSQRRAPPLLSASRHAAAQFMILPLQHGHKKEWPTRRDIPPHEVEHSDAAPQRRARKRSAEARSAGEPIGFLQAARTLAEIKKSEKPAERRYKLSSADIAVVTVSACPNVRTWAPNRHAIPPNAYPLISAKRNRRGLRFWSFLDPR